MTPLKVKAFLESEQKVSVSDVVQAFNLDVDLAVHLLQFWVKRGLCSETRSCKGCQLCPSGVYFYWNTHASHSC